MEQRQQPNGKGGPCWEKKPPECPVRVPLYLSVGTCGPQVQVGVVQGCDHCARVLLTGLVLESEETQHCFEVGKAVDMPSFAAAAEAAVSMYGLSMNKAVNIAAEATLKQNQQQDSDAAADGNSPE